MPDKPGRTEEDVPDPCRPAALESGRTRPARQIPGAGGAAVAGPEAVGVAGGPPGPPVRRWRGGGRGPLAGDGGQLRAVFRPRSSGCGGRLQKGGRQQAMGLCHGCFPILFRAPSPWSGWAAFAGVGRGIVEVGDDLAWARVPTGISISPPCMNIDRPSPHTGTKLIAMMVSPLSTPNAAKLQGAQLDLPAPEVQGVPRGQQAASPAGRGRPESRRGVDQPGRRRPVPAGTIDPAVRAGSGEARLQGELVAALADLAADRVPRASTSTTAPAAT